MTETLTREPSTNERNGHAAEAEATEQYVSFWIGDQLLGVPVNAVQEVLQSQRIARTPCAHPAVAGLLNLRGQIVTAVNLRHRLDLPDVELDHEPHNVVVLHNDESFSFLVDEVGDVIEMTADSMESPPHTLDSRWKSVTIGVFRLEKRLFIILDVGAVLNFSE